MGIILSVTARYFWIVLLALGLAGLATPLNAKTSFGELRFDRVTAANGLNAAFTTTLSQDSQGYIWVGTQLGLIRYDGFRSKLYKNCSPDASVAQGEFIYALHRDVAGRLWAGTGDALCRYDTEHDRFVEYLRSPSVSGGSAGTKVLKIVDDTEGNLWLATNLGLVHFFPDTGRFGALPFPPDLVQAIGRSKQVALQRDRSGNLWLGCVAGLYVLRPGSDGLQRVPLGGEFGSVSERNEVVSLLIDHEQVLWIGTAAGLTSLPDSRAGQIQHFPVLQRLTRNQRITEMMEDNQGDLWLATPNSGVLIWDRQSEKLTEYHHDASEPRSIVGNEIVALFQDRSGTVWIATPIDGVSKVELNSGDFRRISQDTRIGRQLTDNKVTAIFDGPNGELWLGLLGGAINAYNPKNGNIRRLGDQARLNDNPAKYNSATAVAFAMDGKDKMWVVTEAGIRHFDLMLDRYEPSVNVRNAPDFSEVISIHVDHDNVLWALTGAALYRLDQNNAIWISYPISASKVFAKSDSLKSMLEDQHGSLWVASAKKVTVFDKLRGDFREICDRPNPAGTGNGSPLAIMFMDSRGTLWIDNETGFSRLAIKDNAVTSITNFHTDAMVDSMLQDRHGIIWISTDDGVLRLNPASLELHHFNSLDDESVTGYFFYSGLVATDGTIYFGGPHGLTAFRPELVSGSVRPAPQVLITDLQIFNRSVDIGSVSGQDILVGTIQTTRAITLPHHASVFSIEFAALDFENPNANHYAYQLSGFDTGWRYTDASNRLATYTNLGPGHYTFRVKASNRAGVWNESGATLEITVTPPYWKTWWFRSLVLASLLGILLTIYRMRVLAFVRQQRALEALVGQRTQEIVLQKNVIEEKNRQLETINQLQEEHQSELTHFLAVASHDLRQPIHALNIYLGALTEMDVAGSARAMFDKMAKCVQIMDEMFLALLDLSLLEAHAVKPRIEHFSIATILSLIEVEFSPQAHAAGLSFTVEHCNDWIESDANLIKQILANLTANAIRYTKVGGITIHCEKVEGRLRIAVQDTGIGISPSQQSIVFKKFHQLGNADREKSKGIGLGLAIVKRLCELLDLPLALRSVPGQGSVFSIDLPLSATDTQAVTHTTVAGHFTSQVSLSNILAVVIDDDPVILDAMRALLEKWGCAVTTAASGPEAIAMFGTSPRPPDVLICDYRLHVNEDGIDTINMLRNEFNQEIPALLITGDTSSDIIGNLRSGRIGVMHKPLRAELLRDTLVRMLYPDAVYVHGHPVVTASESSSGNS